MKMGTEYTIGKGGWLVLRRHRREAGRPQGLPGRLQVGYLQETSAEKFKALSLLVLVVFSLIK